MRREDERLQDILAAISAIERYANQERSAFDKVTVEKMLREFKRN